ncbi:MAG: hypothetical protein ABJE95_17205 [Byssovorax sp.]
MSRPEILFVHEPRAVGPEDLAGEYLHVVVFGPGHGEAVLVRMPDGEVGVVDGCVDPQPDSSTRDPVSELVEALHVERLLFACLTHPHEDHYLGFAKLISQRRPKHLWWSGAREAKFLGYYQEYLKIRGRTGVDTGEEATGDRLEKLVNAIHKLRDNPSTVQPTRTMPLEDWKVLLRHPAPCGEVRIESILPSNHGVRAAEEDAGRVLHAMREKKGTVKGIQRAFNPNRISGALLLSWGETRVLLGGDAICEEGTHAGWDGLPHSLDKIHMIKVPHHASRGAYSETLWKRMLPDLAVVTCVKNATDPQPPRPDMLTALLQTPSDLALTARPHWWEPYAAHNLCAEPEMAPKAPEAKRSGDLALPPTAKFAPASDRRENAVVVRLDSHGHIVRVQLHGAARRLRLRASPAVTSGVVPPDPASA